MQNSEIYWVFPSFYVKILTFKKTIKFFNKGNNNYLMIYSFFIRLLFGIRFFFFFFMAIALIYSSFSNTERNQKRFWWVKRRKLNLRRVEKNDIDDSFTFLIFFNFFGQKTFCIFFFCFSFEKILEKKLKKIISEKFCLIWKKSRKVFQDPESPDESLRSRALNSSLKNLYKSLEIFFKKQNLEIFKNIKNQIIEKYCSKN